MTCVSVPREMDARETVGAVLRCRRTRRCPPTKGYTVLLHSSLGVYFASSYRRVALRRWAAVC